MQGTGNVVVVVVGAAVVGGGAGVVGVCCVAGVNDVDVSPASGLDDVVATDELLHPATARAAISVVVTRLNLISASPA
jgi:hypothetical protein